jgi:hypothetical protein
MTKLHFFQLSQRELVLDVPGVESRGGFEQHDPAFFVSDGLVLGSARHHDELALFQPDRFVPKFDPKPPGTFHLHSRGDARRIRPSACRA